MRIIAIPFEIIWGGAMDNGEIVGLVFLGGCLQQLLAFLFALKKLIWK